MVGVAFICCIILSIFNKKGYTNNMDWTAFNIVLLVVTMTSKNKKIKFNIFSLVSINLVDFFAFPNPMTMHKI